MEQPKKLMPFLKWAGGKRWLIEHLPGLLPRKWGAYFEPFLGGGAVYFSVKPEHAVLSDLNQELIETYDALSTRWRAVEDLLHQHQILHGSQYYYHMRSLIPSSKIERAARFIYLNRACWNGLYRVNLKGEFNVPIGTKTHVLLEGDHFDETASQLQSAHLVHCDFEMTIELAERGDLLFVDPPYTVRHQLNGFVKYNENLFQWDDQVRLRDALYRAKKRGVKIIATNADHSSIRDLYRKDFAITATTRFSPIGGLDAKRGRFPELVIQS